MLQPRVSIIAAIGEHRELGRKNELIWRISPDLKRVKGLTMGHPIIMGWNTYQSIGHPLPGRTNIVLSFKPVEIPGCVVMTSLEEGLAYARNIEKEEIFIFGGTSVYAATIDITDRLYLTLIHDSASDADAFFPDYHTFTHQYACEEHPEHTPPFTWLILEHT